MSYTPRLKSPPKHSKYYNNKSAGGYLTNITGNYPYGQTPNNRTGLPGWNVLPNCVSWCAGRWAEISAKNKIIYNWNTDAKNFITLAKQFGLESGKIPKLGAIMVWESLSKSGCGHVAICEQVNSATEVVVSESGWAYKGSDGMWTAVHKKGTDGNWILGGDESWMKGRYKFLGFVYHPDVKEAAPLIPKDIKVSFLSTLCAVTVIEKDGYNYIRLRDLEEKLHLCAIGYFNNKVTINGQYVDLTKFNIIKLEDTNYIKATDLQDKLKNCTVSYDTAKKLVVIKPK